jgi:hypothetical protein
MFIATLLLNIFFLQQAEPKIIDGYLNKISAYPGDSLHLYINASAKSASYNLRLYDLSHQVVFNLSSPVFPQLPLSSKSYEVGFSYVKTCTFKVPDLPSGVYLWEDKIPLVIKSRNARITVVYPSNTANAYCPSGGKSFYGFNSTDNSRAPIVSFLRPIGLEIHSEAFLRWMHKERFADVGYVTDLDLDEYKTFSKSKLLIISGHSEYWTLQARRNFRSVCSQWTRCHDPIR